MTTVKIPAIYLKCDEYIEKTKTIFKQLALDDKFTDVTLVSEDGKAIEVHRAIIGYSSPTLYSLFSGDISEKTFHLPIKHDHLKAIVQYIYLGETRVEVGEVKEFLSQSTQFQIWGLWKAKSEKNSAPSETNHSDKDTKLRPIMKHTIENKVYLIGTLTENIKSDPDAPLGNKKKISKKREATDLKFSCKKCDFKTNLKATFRHHKKEKHDKNKEKTQCGECGCVSSNFCLELSSIALYRPVLLSIQYF